MHLGASGEWGSKIHVGCAEHRQDTAPSLVEPLAELAVPDLSKCEVFRACTSEMKIKALCMMVGATMENIMPVKHVQSVETLKDLGGILKDRAIAPLQFFEGKPITIFTDGYYELVEGDGGVTCTLDRTTPKGVLTIEGAESFELVDAHDQFTVLRFKIGGISMAVRDLKAYVYGKGVSFPDIGDKPWPLDITKWVPKIESVVVARGESVLPPPYRKYKRFLMRGVVPNDWL